MKKNKKKKDLEKYLYLDKIVLIKLNFSLNGIIFLG